MVRPSSDSPHRLDQLPAPVRRRLVARTAATTVAMVIAILVVYYVVPWDGGPIGEVVPRILIVLAMLAIVIVMSIRYVVHSEYPMLAFFHALVAVVGFALVSFATVYDLISYENADAFSEPLGRTDALYFALTTMTTVGYGDVHAVTEGARVVVMIQMVVNVVVISVAVRALLREAQRQAGDG